MIETDLTELLSKRAVGFNADVIKELKEHLDFPAYNILHSINMLGRGELWSSIRQVEIIRRRIVSLIGLRTHTDVAEEYRRLESISSESENLGLQRGDRERNRSIHERSSDALPRTEFAFPSKEIREVT